MKRLECEWINLYYNFINSIKYILKYFLDYNYYQESTVV